MAAHLVYLEDYKEELLALWDQYHDEYCDIIGEYWSRIEEKKKKKLRLDVTITRSEIRHEFPQIPFLRAEDEVEAIYQLSRMSKSDVRYLTNNIRALVENESSIFNRLKKEIRCFNLQLKRAEKPKTYAFGGIFCCKKEGET